MSSLNTMLTARRARLRQFLMFTTSKIDEELERTLKLHHKVCREVTREDDEQRFHASMTLVGAFGLAEAFLADLVTEILICFPAKIGKSKKVDLEVVLEEGTIVGIVTRKAQQLLRDTTYKTFPAMMTELKNRAGVNVFSSSAALLDRLNEAKATRDCVLHAGGVANELYTAKAATQQRAKTGDPLPVEDEYVQERIADLRDLCAEFGSECTKKYNDCNKVRVFAGMWESTSLNRILPLAEAWEIDFNKERVHRRERVTTWRWSGSEKMLVDFFLRIHGGPQMDLHSPAEALERWPTSTDTGKLILSWVESPFYL